MKPAIALILGVAAIAGLSTLAVESKYFSTWASRPAAPAPTLQTGQTPAATALLSPAESEPNGVQAVIPMSPDHRAADQQRNIKAQYRTAAKSFSTIERDKEYAVLIGYAVGEGDFELAMDIADSVSAVGTRDEGYAKIVHQAMKVGDVAAADKAAEKISSVIVRDEQFKKIAESCPSNTTTEGAASVLGLDSGNRTGLVQHSGRGR